MYNLKWSIIFVWQFFFFKWVLEGDRHLQTFTFCLGWGCTFAREVCSCLLKITFKEDCNACATFFKGMLYLANPVSPVGFGVAFGTLVTTDTLTCWLTQYWSWLWHLNILLLLGSLYFSAYFVKKLDFAVSTVKRILKVDGFCDFCCNYLLIFLKEAGDWCQIRFFCCDWFLSYFRLSQGSQKRHLEHTMAIYIHTKKHMHN